MKISKWVILATTSLSFIACAKRATISKTIAENPDPSPDPDPQRTAPSLTVQVTSPDDILYVAPKDLKAWGSTTNPSLYTASGDGGLGVDFNEKDKLTPFSGIPFLAEGKNIDSHSRKITLSAVGNPLCPSLFKLDESRSLITIDVANIKGLVTCSLKVQATAHADDNFVTSEKEFQVTVNPTLAFYAALNSNEPILKYLKAYSGNKHNQSIVTIATWLKTQAAELNLTFDPNILRDAIPLENINPLTGLKSLQSLNVSKTELNDLNAFLYFKHLQTLNLSETKIKNDDLGNLNILPNLTVLNIRHLDLKKIEPLAKGNKTLTEIDLSENENISDLNQLSHIPSLKKLNLSKMNLKHLRFLEDLSQISSLNISDNHLAQADDTDLDALAHLSHLESLDVSRTQIRDEFLNRLFPNLTSTLTHFIDVNKYEMDKDFDTTLCSTKANNFEKIPKLSELRHLEYVDIHGNGCNIAKLPIGLKDTAYFSSLNMPKLNYLDISNTPISNLEDLQNSNIETLHIVHHPIDTLGHMLDEGGILMTQEACAKQLQGKSINAECTALPEGQWKSQLYTTPGIHTFTVPAAPAKFYAISIVACSGGDGGQGGQGGQGGYTAMYGYFTDPDWIGYSLCPPSSPTCTTGYSYFIATEKPGAGRPGTRGSVSSIEGIVTTTQDTLPQSYNGHCAGGKGGMGGQGGGIGSHEWLTNLPHPPEPSNGSAGSDGNNKNTSIIEGYSVTPGQVLTIRVGEGGSGGEGSGPAKNGLCKWEEADTIQGNKFCARNGEKGKTGASGTPGYVEIRWREL